MMKFIEKRHTDNTHSSLFRILHFLMLLNEYVRRKLFLLLATDARSARISARFGICFPM